MGTFASKYLPVILLAVGAISSAVSPYVASLYASHPTLTAILAVVATFFPQPHK